MTARLLESRLVHFKSNLQHQLSDLLTFKVKNKMKINFKKTKILPFILSKKLDFLPQLSFPHHEPLEVIYEARLLGVNLTSNLSWGDHVNYITKSAIKKLWIFTQFKAIGEGGPKLSCCLSTKCAFAQP